MTDHEGAPSTAEHGLVSDAALHARHTAAMQIVKRGIEDDRELLLSYVVLPTELIETALLEIAPGAANRLAVGEL